MALKMMVFLLVAAFVGLFFIDGPNGQPIMTIDDFIPTVPDSISDLKPETPDLAPSGPTKVYKWKDENGIWQFSNQEVDSKGNAVEVMELDGDINIMPAIDIPAPSQEQVTKQSRPKSNLSKLPSGLTTVEPEKIAEMMDTINGLQDTIDQRKKDLDSVTGGSN